MAETVLVTFLYVKGQRVRYADDPRVYAIASRTYTEREIMGPVVTYRLERKGIMRETAYEPDLLPVEEADTTPAPLSPEGYAATGGTACPACGGTDLASGRLEPEGIASVTRLASCENCGATWNAVYELTGYEALRRAKEDTHG